MHPLQSILVDAADEPRPGNRDARSLVMASSLVNAVGLRSAIRMIPNTYATKMAETFSARCDARCDGYWCNTRYSRLEPLISIAMKNNVEQIRCDVFAVERDFGEAHFTCVTRALRAGQTRKEYLA